MSFADLQKRVAGRCRRDLSRLLGRRMAPLPCPQPIVSFTFDDFPRTALQVGGAILRKYGAVGTYYAAFGLMNQESPVGRIFSPEDIEQLLSDGHELGCHTYAHCHAWNTEPAAFEESILENQRALSNLVSSAVFKTHSYPLAEPRPATKRRAGRRFCACRGGGQTYNVRTTDLNGLSAFFLEKSAGKPELIKRIIEQNAAAPGWLVFATHDIAAKPTPFGCTPDLFEKVVRWAVESRARILPVAAALETMQLCRP